jgi:general secretion pathway protein D
VRGPRVIANPMNNTLLIQSTAQEYESIEQLIKELDVPPRQVLIEAKIYSVDLSTAVSSGITAALQSKTASGSVGSTAASFMGSLIATGNPATTTLSAAMLVGKSRELLGTVTLMEGQSKAKVLSAPAVIATDSIPASISVGTTVPAQSSSTASGITGATTTGISNVATGIGLSIVARVTPSGIVTMVINQNVSDPQATTSSGSGSTINSPSFATKSITTQVTVQDGDTIAIGGQIQESTSVILSGLPYLDRIPFVGALFGSRSYSKERTELIIFITPHVIYDSNQMMDATEELKDKLRDLRKDVKE